MNFYHILFALKQGFNRNLTWYENLFVRFYNNTIAKLAAKILRIKGNTVSFNQLIQNGNFADNSIWVAESGVTLTVASNTGTFVSTVANNGINQPFSFVEGHKYFVQMKAKVSETDTRMIFTFFRSDIGTFNHIFTTTGWEDVKSIIVPSASYNSNIYIYLTTKTGITVDLQNIRIHDMTAMGMDSYTAEQFEQWLNTFYPLPYYAYNPGTLIPFMGEQIKTVGFNQWDEEWESGSIYESNGTNHNGVVGYWRAKNYVDVLPNTAYCQYTDGYNGTFRHFFYDGNKNYIGYTAPITSSSKVLFTTPNNAHYMRFRYYTNLTNYKNCINISDASKNGTYEPYTSNTLSLPTSTYFPTGMKSARSVYDELTPSKAITRIGSRAYQSGDENDPSVITDGTTTYYPLPTPTETEISPELDLSYPIQWGGTEQILPVNTSTPITSGIVADIKYPDGIRYDQTFVYRVIEKATQLGNRALSIMLGKKVETDNPEEPLDILLKGEK